MPELNSQTGATPALGRRSFLALASGAGLSAAAINVTSPAASAAPLATTWDLTAKMKSYMFADGVSLTYYRYEAVGGAELGSLPFLDATEGTQVTVNIDNQLPMEIRPAIAGYGTFARIAANSSGSFSFTMPPAGTYVFVHAGPREMFFGSGVPHTPDFRPMIGLTGAVVSRPASGAQVLYDGGPSYDRESLLVYEDTDDRWNQAMVQGFNGSGPTYHPNYFTVNGIAFPDTASHPDTTITGNLGDRVLVRLANVGRMRQCIHFHGFHAEIAARNNEPELVLPEKDTIPVPTLTTADVIFEANQLGTYPVHPHSLTAVTANGSYPNGQLALIVIS